MPGRLADVTLGLSDTAAAPSAAITVAASRRAWWLAVAVIGAVLLAPLLVIDVPPILDYPNHLARMVVLAAGARDPVLSRMYAPHWAIIPDLAIDLFIPPMLHVLPPYVAGRIALALVLLLPLAGVLAYHRALFGPGRAWWPLCGALVGYNKMFLLGFMNFLLAVGAALLVAAVWARWRQRYPCRTSLACAVAATGVFFCHLGGLFFLGLLLASQEVERLLPLRRRGLQLARSAAASCGLLALTMLPSAILYSQSSLDRAAFMPKWSSLSEKLAGLIGAVANYYLWLDLLTAGLIIGFVAASWRAGQLQVPPRTRVALAALLLLYVVAPYSLKSDAWLDARFPLMAGYLLFAGTAPRRLPLRTGLAVAAVCAGLLLVRTSVVASMWAQHATDLRALRASIAPVPPGARVLVVRAAPKLNRAFWHTRAPHSRYLTNMDVTDFHTAALLLIERRAFWPLLFTSPSQQPLAVRAPYDGIAMNAGVPPDYHLLSRQRQRPKDLRAAPYLADWPHRFDYVLVLDADGVPDLPHALPPNLQMLNDTGYAALFRIPAAGVNKPP